MTQKKEIKKILKEVFDTKSNFLINKVEEERILLWNKEYRVGYQYIFDKNHSNNLVFVHLYPYEDYDYTHIHINREDKPKLFIDALKKLPSVLKNYFKKFGKIERIAFSPNTNQLSNIYTSPSSINVLKNNFNTDYDIEVLGEDRRDLGLNKGSILMTLKKSLKEDVEEIDGDELLDKPLKTDPSKGIVAPSQKVTSDVCEKEKFCKKQGPITFGQLRILVETAQRKNLTYDIGEGFYKAIIRLFPWFFPQIAVAGFVGSSIRAFNKIIKPGLEDTRGYKKWWGKTLMNIMDAVEGDIPREDPISKIFFISDGLLLMLDRKFKIKFARYIAELASSKSDSETVPEYFVENELRKWVNQKFLLNPPLPPKTLNESEDWSWVRDEEIYYPIKHINDLKIGKKYYIDYRVGYDNERLRVPVNFIDQPNRYSESYQFTGEDENGGLRNYLFFRNTYGGGGLEDMINKGQVTYRKSDFFGDETLNESEEDDWGWAREIEINTDLTPAQIYNRYDSFPVEVVGPYIAGQFSDVVYENGKLYLRTDGWCDFIYLFRDTDSNYGTMGRNLAKAVLCDDDYWEPYDTGDLVNDWVSDVWDLVTDDQELLDYVKKDIKRGSYIGENLYSEKPLTEDMLDDSTLLGELINDEDMFHDLKMELKWAYGSAYNQAASNNVYKAATDAVIDIFGEGGWVQEKNQRGIDAHLLKFDATSIILESISTEISDCWSRCRSYFNPERHYDMEEHENEEEAFEVFCEGCIDKPFDDWGDFLGFYSNFLNETGEELIPSYDEWPGSEDLKEFFKKDVYDRI